MKKAILLFTILAFVLGCKNKEHEEHQELEERQELNKHQEYLELKKQQKLKEQNVEYHEEPDSNKHMNETSFEDLVNNFEDVERDSWQKPEEVIDLLGDINGKRIMDIGAGTGYFTFKMSERGAQVIAADVDERFLNYIEEKKTKTGDNLITLRKTEYDDPLLEEEEVDHVIIVNTYHHIEDRISYFKKVTNGLKKDGLLMVVDYKKKPTAQGPPEAHRLPLTTVLIELKKVGYYNFKIYKDMLENQYVVLAQKPSL